MSTRKKIGEILVDSGLLTAEKLSEALSVSRPKKLKLGQFLIREGLVREPDMIDALSKQLRIDRYSPGEFPVNHDLARLIPLKSATQHHVAPVTEDNGVLLLAMTDPTNIPALDEIQELVQHEVEPIICSESQLDELMGILYGISSDAGGVPHEVGEVDFSPTEETEEETSQASREAAEGQSAVRNVNWILTQAIWERASDIHISPEKTQVRVRLRVDGILKDLPSWPKKLQSSVVSRLKILGNMDIANTRIPQDGRFSAKINNREIHVRISTMPTIYGENLVLRILDMTALVYKLDHLGMNANDQCKIEAFAQRPHGLMLSTGPTGSGKTSTLYALLGLLNKPEHNIITVEDPVEFRIERIRQVELNTKAGMTFASALRSILRQDPDVIMVGEIRDKETALVAMQAALTGHLVLSTMHTNDAIGTITRLKDMGLESFLISSVIGIAMGQRLVRKVCPNCLETYAPSPQALDFWDIESTTSEDRFVRSHGCHQCHNSGFRGRIGIYEVIAFNKNLRQAILENAPEQKLISIARRETGFSFLREDARDKIRQGLTTMEEAASVIVS
ncbi:MAG: Flp pilus assembly complex ATPase component TadA [Opitutales bacterium]|nr:Flp pilus assembly complex ATPase component TadA [Opitutales bacterium]MCH8539731.1 GspE/PulE family protein [Opitutales bacterium]